MKAYASIDCFVPVMKVIALAVAAAVAGCAGSSGGPSRPPSTPYKGETPWSISSIEDTPQTMPRRV